MFKKSIFAIICIFFFSCQRLVVDYRGLTKQDSLAVLTLNVGIINDSEFSEISSKQINGFLSSHTNQAVPLLINFIVDQPRNVVFTFQETHFTPTAKESFQAIMKENIAHLSKSQDLWEIYFDQQVRYDIIFTNAQITPSSLQKKSDQMMLLPASARQSLENRGLLILLSENQIKAMSNRSAESPVVANGSSILKKTHHDFQRKIDQMVFLIATKPINQQNISSVESDQMRKQQIAQSIQYFKIILHDRQYLGFSRPVCGDLIKRMSGQRESIEKYPINEKIMEIMQRRIELLNQRCAITNGSG